MDYIKTEYIITTRRVALECQFSVCKSVFGAKMFLATKITVVFVLHESMFRLVIL